MAYAFVYFEKLILKVSVVITTQIPVQLETGKHCSDLAISPKFCNF